MLFGIWKEMENLRKSNRDHYTEKYFRRRAESHRWDTWKDILWKYHTFSFCGIWKGIAIHKICSCGFWTSTGSIFRQKNADHAGETEGGRAGKGRFFWNCRELSDRVYRSGFHCGLLATGYVFSKKVWLSDSNQRIWKGQRKDRKTVENCGKGDPFAGRYSRDGRGISPGGIFRGSIWKSPLLWSGNNRRTIIGSRDVLCHGRRLSGKCPSVERITVVQRNRTG